jgi:TRAP-type mannitol/chloroaromatic compound transport system permease small subunit
LQALLNAAAAVDKLSRWCAYVASACVLAACLISSGNATLRYAAGLSSNAWLEMQWYLFAYMVMFGAAHVFKVNEHVRVDLVYGLLGTRGRIWIDIVGILLFLLPACVYLFGLTAPKAWAVFQSGEISPNAGGLVRWPPWVALPIGFGLLVLQGCGELVKRVAMLTGHLKADIHYERPVQ